MLQLPRMLLSRVQLTRSGAGKTESAKLVMSYVAEAVEATVA